MKHFCHHFYNWRITFQGASPMNYCSIIARKSQRKSREMNTNPKFDLIWFDRFRDQSIQKVASSRAWFQMIFLTSPYVWSFDRFNTPSYHDFIAFSISIYSCTFSQVSQPSFILIFGNYIDINKKSMVYTSDFWILTLS